MKRRILHPILATLVLLVTGCGSEFSTAPVSGTIKTPDGRPLPSGIITFTPQGVDEKGQSGKPAYSEIVEGKFTLSTYGEGDGAVIGQHVVSLTESWTPDEQDNDAGDPRPVKHRCELSPESTTATVVSGSNSIDLVAIPKKRRRGEEEEEDD